MFFKPFYFVVSIEFTSALNKIAPTIGIKNTFSDCGKKYHKPSTSALKIVVTKK